MSTPSNSVLGERAGELLDAPAQARRREGREAEDESGWLARRERVGREGVGLDGAPGERGAHAALVAKIAAVRRALGERVFINARTCVAMPMHGDLAGDPMVAEVLRRAHLYASAGADGMFVPWLFLPAEIASVARGCPLPLNLMLDPRTPPLDDLARLGVRRLSVGVKLAAVAYTAAGEAARALRQGDVRALVDDRLLAYPQLHALIAAGG